jgi:hypothetical protein
MPLKSTVFGYGVVGRVRRRGEDDFVETRAREVRNEDALQHRLTPMSARIFPGKREEDMRP